MGSRIKFSSKHAKLRRTPEGDYIAQEDGVDVMVYKGEQARLLDVLLKWGKHDQVGDLSHITPPCSIEK